MLSCAGPGQDARTPDSLASIGIVFNPGNPLGPRSSAPFPLPPLKLTPSPSMEGRHRPGVRESIPGSAPTPARGPAATSARARRSPLSSPCRLPGSFVALAGPALWNARASRSQARPPSAETGGGPGRGRARGREKLERRSPSFGGLSARRG